MYAMVKVTTERYVASLHLDFEECPTALNLLLFNEVPSYWQFHRNKVDDSINNVLHTSLLEGSSGADYPEREVVRAALNKDRFSSFHKNRKNELKNMHYKLHYQRTKFKLNKATNKVLNSLQTVTLVAFFERKNPNFSPYVEKLIKSHGRGPTQVLFPTFAENFLICSETENTEDKITDTE